MRRALEGLDLEDAVIEGLVRANQAFFAPGRWARVRNGARLNAALNLADVQVRASRPAGLEDPVPDPCVEDFIAAIPAMGEYTLPSRSAKVNLASLMTSTDTYRDPGQPGNLGECVRRLADLLPAARAPSVLTRGVPTRREVCFEILKMSPTSNAGWPYCLDGLPKRDFACSRAADVAALVQARVMALDQVDWRQLERCGPVALWDAGLIDPHLAIEKMEPLKRSKIGRQRVVVCGSVVTEALHRVFDARGNDAMSEEWGNCPSLIGIGFDEDSVARTFDAMESLAEECGTRALADNDASGFEFSRKEWHMLADADVRSLRYGFELGSHANLLYRKTSLLEARKIYVMHDGQLVVQNPGHYGIQGSGSFRTSYTNTVTRTLDAMVIGCPSARAAGDDCVEPFLRDAVRLYDERCGMTIKDYKEASPDKFELCSHLYEKGRPLLPLRAAKSFYKQAAFGFNDPVALQQVITQFRHAPEWPAFIDVLSRPDGRAAKRA